MTPKADSNGGPIDFELLFKQVGGIAVLLYALGILMANSYPYKLGVSDFEFLKPRFVYTGALLLLPCTEYICACSTASELPHDYTFYIPHPAEHPFLAKISPVPKNSLITLSSSQPSEYHARIERAITLCWLQPMYKDGRMQCGVLTSGVSSKAANWGQIKTGQRKWSGAVRSCTRSSSRQAR
jgi:hypothetical protein